jgi:hypothetical protein
VDVGESSQMMVAGGRDQRGKVRPISLLVGHGSTPLMFINKKDPLVHGFYSRGEGLRAMM